jgi:hypothetical protein
MEHVPEEITREYRLDFNHGETAWDDPMPPEIICNVLGRNATCRINRTSLLAWSLMNIPQVQVADVACGGWIRISISTGADFDELVFKREVADIVAGIRQVRSDASSRTARQLGPSGERPPAPELRVSA